MIGFALVEVAIMLGLVAVFVTQVAVPLWRGTVLWPVVTRKRDRELRRRLAEAEQEAKEAEILAAIAAARAKATDIETHERVAHGVRAIRLREETDAEGEKTE